MLCADIRARLGYARRVSANAQDSVTVIVDAGHGGMDGGATAQDGTVEKDINLSIALNYAICLTRRLIMS